MFLYECSGMATTHVISVYTISYYGTGTYVHTTDNIDTGTYFCECTAAVLVRLGRKCLDMLLRKAACSIPFVCWWIVSYKAYSIHLIRTETTHTEQQYHTAEYHARV